MPLVFDAASHTYTLDGAALPSVTAICRYLSYDLKSDKPWLAQAAAERGSRVHEACALLDYGEEPEERAELRGYLTAYRRFLQDYRPEWEGVEYRTANAGLGLAGTVDRFGTFYDGVPCILDIKTGAKLHRAPITAQLTGYSRLLAVDRVQFHAARLYALRLEKSGLYDLQEYPPDEHLLNACLYIEQAQRRKAR